jgi:hypothetical protein
MACLAVLRERGARRAQRAKANPSRWRTPRPTRQIRAEPYDCSTSGVSVSRRRNPAFCSLSRLMTRRPSARRADPSRIITFPGPVLPRRRRSNRALPPRQRHLGRIWGFLRHFRVDLATPSLFLGRNRTWDSQPHAARTSVSTFLPQGLGGPDQPSGAMIRSCCEE